MDLGVVLNQCEGFLRASALEGGHSEILRRNSMELPVRTAGSESFVDVEHLHE